MKFTKVPSGAVLGVSTFLSVSFAGGNAPTPVSVGTEDDAPYKYTGIVASDLGGGDLSIGSGSVAIHPNFVVGCAHVNYDESKPGWLTDNTWYWKWNGVGFPPDPGLLLDGQANFKSYGKLVKKLGPENPKTFNLDFVVNYSTSDVAGGEFADWIERGDLYLQTQLPKFITGYPSGLYEDTDADQFRMHETGSFRLPFTLASRSKDYPGLYLDGAFPNYMEVRGVSGGQGNSGGPVWGVKNGQWSIAGVMVSKGLTKTPLIGVYGIGKDSWSRINSALRSSEVGGALPGQLSTSVSAAGVPAAVADAKRGSSTTQRNFSVSGLVGSVETLKLDLVINHSRRHDLRVQLRSPSGTSLTLFNLGSRKGPSPRNLVSAGKRITGFEGQAANGVWVLSVQDAYPGGTGTLSSASLTITTR